MKTTFVCSVCSQTIEHNALITTGYAITKDNKKVCYKCCAEREARELEKTGKGILYLSVIEKKSVRDTGMQLSNWPGTLTLPVLNVVRGRHNIAGSRTDVWFKFAGQPWHGIQYGEFTQICHCKRIKI